MRPKYGVRTGDGAQKSGGCASAKIFLSLLLLCGGPAAAFVPARPAAGAGYVFRAAADRAERDVAVGPVRLELSLGGDVTVAVELHSSEDATVQARRLVAEGVCEGDPTELEDLLRRCWRDATERPPPYAGPRRGRSTAAVSIELPAGLVLEVAASTLAGAGVGVFVRRTGGDVPAPGVLQTVGSAFSGYGACKKVVSSPAGLTAAQRDRTFQFRLEDGVESSVWYGGRLTTAGAAMRAGGVDRIVGHELVAAADGTSRLVPDDGDPYYLVPEEGEPAAASIETIGQFMNDLAGGSTALTEDEYNALSLERNLLVLVPTLVLTEEGTALGPAGMPVLTMSRSVYIASTEPMEVGCHYGYQYWQ